MAGLLGSLETGFNFLFDKDRYNQQQDADAYGALLEQYPVAQGAGGLLADRPSEFYMQAGKIPGYAQMAQQQQVGNQSMQRQMQGQQWEANNMSMAQKVAADANERQARWTQDRREYEYDNLNRAQEIGAQMDSDRLGMQYQEMQQRQQQLAQQEAGLQAGAQYPALGLTGKSRMEYYNELQNLDRAEAVATDTLDYLDKSDLGDVALSPVDRKTLGTQYAASMLPYLQKRFQAGAMQEAEQELFSKLAGEPTAIFELSAKQRDLVRFWQSDIQQERANKYRLSGNAPPPVGRGTSAFAASRNAQSAPTAAQREPWTGGQ